MSNLHGDVENSSTSGGEHQPEAEYKPEAIAIIGAAGRFPRARNLAEFWQRLCAGEELVTVFSDEELAAAGVDSALLNNPHYVKARAVLEDADMFDAQFFGINPREAELLDPQQRVFLETAWHALEDAGYDSARYDGAIGVYAGLSINTYLANNLLRRPDVVNQVGAYQIMLASDKDYVATRTSYKLNLRGPSINIQTACSTSLVAVQVACQGLLNYQCDIALAGGVSVSSPRVSGYMYQQGMILSPDGHCRPFDARGRGIVGGEGAGVVVLKRLSEALADGDTIRAVILGAAVNNDGSDKVGFTAPSVQGQSEVITMAQAMAGVTPDSIQYVEAHGTATELGDPIEMAALTQAFRLGTQRRGYCAIGSVKSNMGHTDAAAGVAGLIKTMLALQHRQIPPSLHFEQPNPNIDFASSPFYVAAHLADWPAVSGLRRAGVSSFGIGGTNAHVVVEEAPPAAASKTARRYHLLPLSALTPAALDNATAALARHLEAHPDLALADVAHTLQVGRRAFGRRRFAVCEDRSEAVTRLANYQNQPLPTSDQPAGRREVVFLFPGQGAQYVEMGRDLYTTEAVFRTCIDECAELLRPHLGLDLRDLLYPQADKAEEAAAALRQTMYTQPALFVIEYALARLWMSWGIQPRAMIGHSIGEYVAACLAGVFSLADGLALVAARGKLMQSLPSGSMLAVPLAEHGVAPYLGPDLALAAVNAPQMCVVAGPAEAVQALEARLATDGVQCQRLHTSHAFHSAMMDPILPPFAALVAKVALHAPALPYLSNVTGTWVTAQQATDPQYWAQHLRSTVRFADGVGEALRNGGAILLEVGPGHSLASLVKQHSAWSVGVPVLSSLRHPHDRSADDLVILQTLGRLWLAGAEIDWSALYAGEKRRRVSLPGYPFERARYWLEPGTAGQTAGQTGQPASQTAAQPTAYGLPQSLAKQTDIAHWFYVPFWKQMDLPHIHETEDAALPLQNWLLFADRFGLASALAIRLHSMGHTVNVVQLDAVTTPLEGGVCSLSPRDEAGYSALFERLHSLGQIPDRIVHLWNVGGDDTQNHSPADVAAILDISFYSLLHVAQGLMHWSGGKKVQLDVVASGLHDVTGVELLTPAKAAVLGPCLVIPEELPQVTCRSIDIVLTAGIVTPRIEALVWAELLHTKVDTTVVALRGQHRWAHGYEEMPLAPVTHTPRLLRPGGVYLITGGLGGIGLALAEVLAERVQARLVLTARTPLPNRTQWTAWLAEHGEDDPTSRKILAIRALEAKGSQVLTFAADVADVQQMRAVVDGALAAFGEVNGVIHAAGVMGSGIIPLKTREMADQVLAPKVLGTAVLDHVLAGLPIDFMLLCSSFNSIVGTAGQVDYSAANAYLDAFAHAKALDGGPWTVSVNWATWQEVGMAYNAPVTEQMRQLKQRLLSDGMLTSEAQNAFERVLTNPLPQWIVSPQSFNGLLATILPEREPIGPETLDGTEPSYTGQQEAAGSKLHARPALQTAYVAPRNAVEAQIAEVWQELFGIDRIGVDDNFFELGGHSLMATQVLVRLQECFGIDLPARIIFETHTIAELASQLEIILWVAQSPRSQEDTAEDREELEF